MATRAVTARIDGDGWRGRYIHSDGYPEHQGPELWRLVHERFVGDVGAALRYLTEEHSYWSYALDECGPHCAPCGKGTREDIWYDFEATADSWVRWVYVLDPDARTLAVLLVRRSDGRPEVTLRTVARERRAEAFLEPREDAREHVLAVGGRTRPQEAVVAARIARELDLAAGRLERVPRCRTAR